MFDYIKKNNITDYIGNAAVIELKHLHKVGDRIHYLSDDYICIDVRIVEYLDDYFIYETDFCDVTCIDLIDDYCHVNCCHWLYAVSKNEFKLQSMITKEKIKKGFETGLISLEDSFESCTDLCCRIGDNAFYFIFDTDIPLTVEEYQKKYTLDQTINILYSILKDVESAEENGIDCVELEYYESVLS